MKSFIRILKKIIYTRPLCPVDKKFCAHYDGMGCTFDNSCPVLKELNNDNN